MTVFKFRNLKNGQATPIPPGEFTVGRADDTYIHLEDASVSRQHAVIYNNEAGLFVEDLGSANGTAAHGDYLTQRAQIGLGDVVYFGSVPFRIDPEVAGEVEAAPSAGMRTQNRAYMKRETERLPAQGGVGRTGPQLTSEQLSAPQVNADNDEEAESLNAITMRDPEVRPVQPAGFPPVTPGAAPVKPVRSPISFPVPQPQRQPLPRAQSQPQPQPESQPQSQVVAKPLPNAEAAQRLASLERSPHQEAIAAPASDATRSVWLVMFFLAGLAAGLLLALYFAKIFIEMGGKVSALP